MSILFGHPVGNPNSHNAALAYFEAGLLECFCVAWMPSENTIDILKSFELLRPSAQRLERRHVPSLSTVPKVQGRVGEVCRLLMRALGHDGEHITDQNNRWLMRTMVRECRRPAVVAVHSYENCSLWPFIEARRLNKACIYDLPTCYYPAWEELQTKLNREYSEWVPSSGLPADYDLRLAQKQKEMELADLALVASRYVESTVLQFYPQKRIVRAPYGVDSEFWSPGPKDKSSGPLRFIYAGNLNVRKGIPLLIDAWSKAALRGAELNLVGSWGLASSKLRCLPAGITWHPPCSSQALRDRHQESHVFVFPSYSDGFGMALLEAMACGLPAIASEASIGPEIVTRGCGFTTPPGDLDRLVELLRWFDRHRDKLLVMGQQARIQAARCTWSSYRSLLNGAVSKLV
jgi:alpha-maltose-1-phosphate synthase